MLQIFIALFALQVRGEIIDLSHPVKEGMPNMHGNIGYKIDQAKRFFGKFPTASNETMWAFWQEYCSGAAEGTHLILPSQYTDKHKKTADQVPIDHLVMQASVVSIPLKTRSKVIRKDRLKAKAADIRENGMVIIKTGHSEKWENSEDYLGGKDINSYKFPGFNKEAAQWLLDTKKPKIVAIDSPAVDKDKSTIIAKLFASKGVMVIVNLKTDDLPETLGEDNLVFVGMHRLRESSISPARVLLASGEKFLEKTRSNKYKWLELTFVLGSGNPRYHLFPDLNVTDIDFMGTSRKAKYFCGVEHYSTHIDAPCHFVAKFDPKLWNVSDIPVERFLGLPLVKLDPKEKMKSNPNHAITKAEILEWEKKYGKIKPNSLVIVETGRTKYWPDAGKYFGMKNGQISNPAVEAQASKWLGEERGIWGTGSEAISIDRGSSKAFLVHRLTLQLQVYGLENVANVGQIPDGNEGLAFVMPVMNFYKGSGGQVRMFARVLKDQPSKANRISIELLSVVFSVVLGLVFGL